MSTASKLTLSRRRLLGLATMSVGSALAVVSLAGCDGASAQLCADPEKLSDEQANLRASLHYTERAPGGENCSGCAFFRGPEEAPCGECDLLKGPVNPQGHCDSWSRKTAAAG